jgi:tRNA-binding EMAP/Myf-like protein
LIPVEEMKKGLVIVFANLKPRKLADIMSNGMIVCASTNDKGKVELLRPADGSKVGERVQLTGNPILGQPLPQEIEAVINPKKKYAERLLPVMKTNDNCEVTYNGVTLETSSGIIRADTLKNANIS